MEEKIKARILDLKSYGCSDNHIRGVLRTEQYTGKLKIDFGKLEKLLNKYLG